MQYLGPPYWPPQPPQATLAEQIRQCVEGIEALSKMKKDLEDKDKEKKDKKKVEGLSKSQIFWIMLFLSPGVGPAMAYLWINSLHATMQIVQQSFK
jgi:hypothetical protein